MMANFVAFVWDEQKQEEGDHVGRMVETLRCKSSRWTRSFAAGGLSVFTKTVANEGADPYLSRTGIVLGQVFQNPDPKRYDDQIVALRSAEAAAVLDACGRSFVDKTWGAYVAFVTDQRRDAVTVVRDCSGQVPCYYTIVDGVAIFFTDIEDVIPLSRRSFSIDYEYLAAFVHDPDLQIRKSGLIDVCEVLAGEAVEFRHGIGRQIILWDPRILCREQSIEDHHEAASLLRSTTQYCVKAWSSVHGKILLRLSGGLDSAIVLGCLLNARHKEDIACVNLYGDYLCEDERIYARGAARQAGVALTERPLLSPDVCLDSRALSAPRSPKPSLLSFWVSLINGATEEVSAAFDAGSVWTGEGGDHLFLDNRTCLPLSDYLCSRRLGADFFRVLDSAARLSRTPYISVLRTAWLQARSDRPWVPAPTGHGHVSFVRESALPRDLAEYISHPWRDNLDRVPKGKQCQLYYLADLLHRHRPVPHAQRVPLHHPLMSKPLMELCLQIPTYRLVYGGRQRALARDVFRDIVPHKIIQRQDKGSASLATMELLRRSKAFVRETILDGVLVRQGVLREDVITPYLTEGQPSRGEYARRFVACVAAECWVQTWKSSMTAGK